MSPPYDDMYLSGDDSFESVSTGLEAPAGDIISNPEVQAIEFDFFHYILLCTIEIPNFSRLLLAMPSAQAHFIIHSMYFEYYYPELPRMDFYICYELRYGSGNQS